MDFVLNELDAVWFVRALKTVLDEETFAEFALLVERSRPGSCPHGPL